MNERSAIRRRWVPIAVVLLVAAFFRLYRLPTMPWGLAQDEVGNADISLALTRGERAPFLSGGYGHEPLFHYLQLTAIRAFGDNVIGIRMPAVAAGMLLIASAYALVRRRYGQIAGLTTACGLAVSWWPIVFGRIGIRAITFPLLLTLATYFALRAIDAESSGRVLAGGARQLDGLSLWGLSGLLFGGTFYTYTAARLVPFLALVWLAYGLAFQRKALRRHWRGIVLALCVCAAVAGPLYLYLRAHPELDERVRQLAGPLQALRQGDLRPLWRGVVTTLGMFSFDSDARWTYGIPTRPIFEPVSAALFYLGLVLCVTQVRRPAPAMALGWLGVALVPSMLAPDAPSTVRAIGALPVAYAMLGVAVAWLWRGAVRRGTRPRLGLALALIALAVGNAIWTYRDGFIAWASDPEVYWLYKTHFADIALYLDRQSDPAPSVVYEAWVGAVDVHSVRRLLKDETREPRWAQGGRSFVWPAGTDVFTLAMPIYSSCDPTLWGSYAGMSAVIATSPYRFPDGRPGVTFYRIQTEPARSELVADVSANPLLLPETGDRPVPLPVDFGGQVALLGYEMAGYDAEAGEARVITAWRILSDKLVALSAFVHVLDLDGNLVAQYDAFDAWAESLQPGDVVAQLHPIPVESPGEYRLQIGVYTQADQVRLPALVDGSQGADRLWSPLLSVAP
jgi:4-amino-4-deoxy-L-arabinose transferase-like glycosyltransferase